MRKFIILITGIIAIVVVTILNFYPDEVKLFVYNITNGKDFVLPTPNDYFIDENFKYLENYTDDPKNKTELLNYIYYIVNSGSTYADGECHKSYKNCLNDLNVIANDENTLSIINNFVHPYNSFKTISFTYNEYGRFSLIVEHIYTPEDIATINYAVDDLINNEIRDNMTTTDKIKVVHDYIINNTKYDSLKTNNINDTTYKSNTAYGVFIQKYGICSGYSDAMAIVLNKLEIPNYKISNNNHIWNLIYINGVWAHLDATWDDPVSEYNQNRDTYFLINYEELTKLNDDTHSFNKNVYLEAYEEKLS